MLSLKLLYRTCICINIFPSHFPLVIFQCRAKRIKNAEKGVQKKNQKNNNK